MHIPHKKFFYFTLVLSLFGYFTNSYLSGVDQGIVQIVFHIFLAIFLTVVLRGHSIIRNKWDKRKVGFSILRVFLVIGMLQGMLFSIVGIFSWYENSFPGALASITLSNGSKTVVFEQMSHIATPSYYRDVHQRISTFTGIIMIEGVGTGTQASREKFDKMMGMQFGTGLYGTVANIIGLEEQNYAHLLGGIPRERIFNVDLTLDRVVELIGTGGIKTDNPIDIEARLIAAFESIPARARPFVSYFLRSTLNYVIKDPNGLPFFDVSSDRTFSVILRDRNEHLAHAIQDSSAQNITVLYGALHFEGVLENLKKYDNNWKITNVYPTYPYVP